MSKDAKLEYRIASDEEHIEFLNTDYEDVLAEAPVVLADENASVDTGATLLAVVEGVAFSLQKLAKIREQAET